MYDFKCKDSHIIECFVDVDIKEVQCSVCDGTATRILTPPRIYLDPISGDHPSATSKWARQRAEKLAVERKTNANHGS
jgi:ubiquitin C-terminal hydrolase